MKKTIFILAFFAVLVGGAFAQISFSVSGGASLSFEDMSYPQSLGFDTRSIGFPILADVGYTLPMEISGAIVSVGGRFGYHNVWGFSYTSLGETLKTDFTALPIMLFGRAEINNLFFDLGIGVSKWTIEAKVDGTSIGVEEGLDFATMLSTGYALPLSNNLDLLLFASYFRYSVEDGDEKKSATAGVSANVGVRFSL